MRHCVGLCLQYDSQHGVCVHVIDWVRSPLKHMERLATCYIMATVTDIDGSTRNCYLNTKRYSEIRSIQCNTVMTVVNYRIKGEPYRNQAKIDPIESETYKLENNATYNKTPSREYDTKENTKPN